MHIETYDYITGKALNSTPISELDFGDLIQNQHSSKPVVLRFKKDSTDSTAINFMEVFLENKGPWIGTEYGYKVNHQFTPSIESGSLTQHFNEVPGASRGSGSGVHLNWDGQYSDYLWIDSQIKDATGMGSANFRFFYDF